ncbi:MAG TPA: hypothetical protein VG649_17240 [Candidatus Angelobacter sp.]|nr:hypothetical protein [Candidatus Angelobacter sp.]
MSPITSPQFDLDQLEQDVISTPLKSFDLILDLFGRTGDESTRLQLRRFLCQCILTMARISDCPEAETEIFDREYDDHIRQFIAICLLRFIACSESWSSDATAFRSETFKLLDSCLGRHLYGPLKIDIKKQTFEKERVLRSYVLGTERAISESLSALQKLKAEHWDRVSVALHDIKKSIGRAKPLIGHFVEKDMINGSRLEELSSALQEYFQADERNAIQAYHSCKSTLERYLLQAQKHDSRYSRDYLAVLGLNLLQLCVTRFEESSISAPATLSLKSPEKRYPLYAAGVALNFSFTLNNVGPGYAFDVYCRVKNIDDAVELNRNELFLGDLAPRPITVEFPVTTKRPADTILVELEWEWRNFDHTTATTSELVELVGQPSGIDWDNLQLQEPYRLEPVFSDNELIGRTEILNRLISHAKGNTVGSSCIYGQKRVGKTSIANAVKSRLAADVNNHFLVIYAETGSYIHPDPNRTIEQLGSRLCKQIKQSDKRFGGLQIPDFDGALTPICDFLDDASAIAPGLRIVFILDEFDKVPVDIFKRGLIGDAFFSTIRSISHMPNVGFILVGGERMQFVFDCQGEALNKFQMVRIDYFEKERHWSDFHDLIRRPVKPWLLFSDEAIVNLYIEAAGNPYFTVHICRSLFKLMVARRDCHVTSNEVNEAINAALQNCTPASFAHFWEDGILEPGDRQEEKSMQRRQVLLSFVTALRRSGFATKESIISGAETFGMDGYAVERELGEFVHRQVLSHNAGIYTCKIPFFERWLKEVGPLEISTTFTDLEAIQARKREEEKAHVCSEEIIQICSRWPQYKGRRIGPEQVRGWLEQFGDNTEQRLMFTLLENIKFYSEDEIRSRMQEAHGIVTRGLIERRSYRQVKRSDILVSYLDGPGKSGAHFARLYIDENSIYRDNLIEFGHLSEAIRKDSIQALVFTDDFIGTGSSVCGYLERLALEFGNQLRSTQLRIFLVAVSGFYSGKERAIETVERLQLPVKIHVCDAVDDSRRCFNESSPIFLSDLERLRAKDVAYKKGVTLCRQAPLGYNDSQALIVFSHNCPNNSLPILWDKSDHWSPLFRRD